MSDLSRQMLAAQIEALSDADKAAFGLAEAKVASAEELRGAVVNTIKRLIAAKDWDCLAVVAMWFALHADDGLVQGLADFVCSAGDD